MAVTTNLLLPLLETGQAQKETTVNTSLAYLDDAVAGYFSKSVAGAIDVTLTEAEARHMFLEVTGAITANINVIVPLREQMRVVFNNTSGAFTVTVKHSTGTGIAVTQGTKAILYSNATNVLSAFTGGGGGSAPTTASYLTLGTDATLTAERVLTAGANVLLTDAGAGSTLTVDALTQTVALAGDISPATLTADTHDYTPAGLSTASTLRLATDASRNLTGLTGGADGRILIIHNVGSFALVLVDESASSTAANRFALTANLTLGTDESCLMRYDSTTARWRLIAAYSAAAAALSGGAANKIAYWTSATALSNDTSLHWDSTTDTLGLIATAAGTSGVGVLALGLGTVPTTGPTNTAQLFALDETAGIAGVGMMVEGGFKHLFGRSALIGTHTRSSNMTQGLLIDQGAGGDAILQLTSSDVAHGMTSIVDTTIYADLRKVLSSDGGLQLRGLTETTLPLLLSGIFTTSTTTKTSTTDAPVMIEVGKKSGTTIADTGATDILFGVGGRFGANPTAFLVARDGSTWQQAYGQMTYLAVTDGITAPGAGSGVARIYVDTADGSLKVVFASGTVKTLTTDP
jgi:hypothetical protein